MERRRRRGEGEGERERRLKLIESLPRIHYPGLLVILERRLRSRATALDALEEYKTRGSWVPHGLPLFLSFLPHPSPPSSRVYLSFLLPSPRLSIASLDLSFSPSLPTGCLLTPVPHRGSESFWGFRYISTQP